MAGKSKAPLIFGITALLAGGGLYYFFKIHEPRRVRGAAQDEITAWEQRLDAVRGCLLGDKPASRNADEALAVRELAPDLWDRKTCTQLIAKLSRGVAEDTGIMGVEQAWTTIDHAAGKVASAFASHVDPSGEAPAKRSKESALPAALDELEAAHADLRAAAGMDPPASASLPALPEAKTLALGVTALEGWSIPSRGGVLAFGSIKDKGEAQLVLVPGQTPRVLPIPAGGVRAMPAGTWGAAGLREEVAFGTIDPAGAFADMQHLPVKLGARVGVVAGTWDDASVVYDSAGQLVFAWRRGGDKLKLDTTIEAGRIVFAMDPAGHGIAAWTKGLGPDGALQGAILVDGQPPRIVDLGTGAPAAACETDERAWIASSDQVIAFADEPPANTVEPHALPQHSLIGCSRSSALMFRYGSTHYAVCDKECRAVELPAMRPTSLATLAGDKVVALRTQDRVIGVWREGAPPAFFATQKPVTATLAYSDGKVIDVLGETDDGVVVVRISL